MVQRRSGELAAFGVSRAIAHFDAYLRHPGLSFRIAGIRCDAVGAFSPVPAALWSGGGTRSEHCTASGANEGRLLLLGVRYTYSSAQRECARRRLARTQ